VRRAEDTDDWTSSRTTRRERRRLGSFGQFDDRLRPPDPARTDAATQNPCGLELNHPAPERRRGHGEESFLVGETRLPEPDVADTDPGVRPGTVQRPEDPGLDHGVGGGRTERGDEGSKLRTEQLASQQLHRTLGPGPLPLDAGEDVRDELRRRFPPERPFGPITHQLPELAR
jgi:hypothetical protein